MLLNNLEFFTYEEEVWYRKDGAVARLTESEVDLIHDIAEMISTFYPDAFKALSEEYVSCAPNQPYYRFRIVSRFVRCNFSHLDHIPDIDAYGHCNFEAVQCPLRGECRHDHVICRPSFAHRLSAAELRVLDPLYRGLSEAEIADSLCLSVHTVHNHIRNAYTRLGIHSRAEFFKYATINDLFHA